MARFRITPEPVGIGEGVVIAPNARAAIQSEIAKLVASGAEMLDAGGVVIARKLRVEFDGGWIVAWVPTQAWPDLEPPVDLSSLLEDAGAVQ